MLTLATKVTETEGRPGDGRREEPFAQWVEGLCEGEAAELSGAKDVAEFVRRLRGLYDARRLEECAFQRLLATALNWVQRDAIADDELDSEFAARIPIAFARAHRLVGLRVDDAGGVLVVDGTLAWPVVDHVAAVWGRAVRVELAPVAVIHRGIQALYGGQTSDFDAVLGTVAAPDGDIVEELESGDLLDHAARAPVIKLVSMMLLEAVKRRASDVHIQPFAERVQIRFRIDGVLFDYLEVPLHLLDEVVSRIKVLGRMDIAEKRLAQDGRSTVTLGDKVVDLRISVIPTNHGERVVVRLLDKSARLYTLQELGMAAAVQTRFEQLIERTHGIILVTGPTGSGKSTTLYAALQHLDYKQKNIITLEDPIEYQLPGVSQMQVAAKKGMTFATGLRSVLRQDPDVIMVGEIRDEETARMAIQSSLTGHLVFSTLHTNDAAGAVTRLLDLGVEPYLVASSVLAVVAQRLVRIVCPKCRRVDALTAATAEQLQVPMGAAGLSGLAVAVGCAACAETGYHGRKGVFELLCVDDGIRSLVMAREKADAIKACAVRAGMSTLRRDAIRKMLEQQTTMQEVLRVSSEDGGDVLD